MLRLQTDARISSEAGDSGSPTATLANMRAAVVSLERDNTPGLDERRWTHGLATVANGYVDDDLHWHALVRAVLADQPDELARGHDGSAPGRTSTCRGRGHPRGGDAFAHRLPRPRSSREVAARRVAITTSRCGSRKRPFGAVKEPPIS